MQERNCGVVLYREPAVGNDKEDCRRDAHSFLNKKFALLRTAHML
jgi:hypothetical protein